MTCASVAGKVVGITGGGGFIGFGFVDRLRNLNQPPKEIRVLDLSAKRKEEIERRGAIPFVGSVNDEAIVSQLCAGCDVIIHLAAIVKANGDWNLFRKVNVEGTRNVATIAAKSGVKKFVFFSSVMVYGFFFKENVEESGPFRGDNNPYCQTKIEGEEVVQQFAKTMQVHIIRPGDVYGTGNSVWVVPFVEIARTQGRLMLPGTDSSVINHVYIDNLIDGVFLVMDKAPSGEAYNITDDERTSFYKYCCQLLVACGDQDKPVKFLPPFLFIVLLYILLLFSFIKVKLGGDPLPLEEPITTVRFLGRSSKYSIEKIKKLGYVPKVNLAQGLEAVGKFMKDPNVNAQHKKRV